MNIQLKPIEIARQEKLKREKPLAYAKFQKYPEKRAKGESTAIVQIQYRFLCNLLCCHCGISSLRKEEGTRELTIDNIRSLGNQMDELGLASVNISGGEPSAIKELYEVISALKPNRFYTQCDSNGLLITESKARYLKIIGVDRMQLSIDSLNEKEHDEFRRRSGSWKKCMEAIEHIKNANLDIQIATVVDRKRLYSDEFIQFLEYMKKAEASVSAIWPKPVGEWEDKVEIITLEDKQYFRELEKKYDVYEHTTEKYGVKRGCCMVKHLINITQYGEVTPCCYYYVSLGNVFNMPLKDILEKGMKYFGNYNDKCLMSEDIEFINKYVSKTWNKKELPIPIERVMSL